MNTGLIYIDVKNRKIIFHSSYMQKIIELKNPNTFYIFNVDEVYFNLDKKVFTLNNEIIDKLIIEDKEKYEKFIQEQEKIEREILKAKKELEEAQKEKEEFEAKSRYNIYTYLLCTSQIIKDYGYTNRRDSSCLTPATSDISWHLLQEDINEYKEKYILSENYNNEDNIRIANEAIEWVKSKPSNNSYFNKLQNILINDMADYYDRGYVASIISSYLKHKKEEEQREKMRQEQLKKEEEYKKLLKNSKGDILGNIGNTIQCDVKLNSFDMTKKNYNDVNNNKIILNGYYLSILKKFPQNFIVSLFGRLEKIDIQENEKINHINIKWQLCDTNELCEVIKKLIQINMDYLKNVQIYFTDEENNIDKKASKRKINFNYIIPREDYIDKHIEIILMIIRNIEKRKNKNKIYFVGKNKISLHRKEWIIKVLNFYGLSNVKFLKEGK
jgi:hypothetical protein